MADAGLFIGWGEVVRGREERALDIFNETLEYYGQLQSDGRLEDFEVAVLDPHGGELQGYAMLRGSEDQIDAVRRDENFQRLMTRASLVVDDLGIIGAAIGEGLGRAIAIYQDQLAVAH
jgi:hypothetical protein